MTTMKKWREAKGKGKKVEEEEEVAGEKQGKLGFEGRPAVGIEDVVAGDGEKEVEEAANRDVDVVMKEDGVDG